jgi:hypothetical protein
MPRGTVLLLNWAHTNHAQPATARANIAVGTRVVVALGEGCESAADFHVTGPARITATQPAPLPNSGANAAQITALAPGAAVVRIVGRRTCSQRGVTSGMCFGTNRLLGILTLHIRAT